MRAGGWLTRFLSALPVVLLLSGQVPAQEGNTSDPVLQILILDRARLFEESAFGKASVERERIATRALEAENAGIQAELVAEEQELTNLRKTLSVAEFSARAAAFDEKVERIRAQQDSKARDLAGVREEDSKAFQRAALPVLGELMAARGAQVLLEKSSVILSLSLVDVTDEAIAKVDSAFLAGITPQVVP
ncbi:Chaperone protein Skp [Paracoccaceae bacterium]|jgi:Skp family chaperone for outer membrane proteins